mgnify:CR=1 FL=1
MKLTVGSRTDVGPRKMNQDHHGWWPDLGLYVVADGMGGHNAGEVASHMAVETIHGFIAESANIEELDPEFADVPILRQRRDNAKVDVVMSNSFGFGGTNACLLFSRYDH